MGASSPAEAEGQAAALELPPAANGNYLNKVAPAAEGEPASPSKTSNDGKDKDGKAKDLSVPYMKLLSTADKNDYLIMLVGTIAAMGNGCAWPVFAILFGDFSNTFGNSATNDNFMNDVSDIALQFLYLSLGALVCSFLQASCWMWTGNRQTNRLRQKYLDAVLRQDISFFDTKTTTGSLLQGLNEDSINVQAAVSEKVGHFVQHTSTFIAGFIVAFTKGWDMTLVMVGCLPFLAAVGFILSKVTTSMQTAAASAYTQASSIAQQSISQVRTVVAYGQEERSLGQYDAALEHPLKVGIRQAIFTGLSLGGINAIVYFTYAIAFYFGAWRASEGHMDGGEVMNVLVAALLGGFSLGQASPVLEAFAKGRQSGGNVFAVIERKPDIDVDEPGGAQPSEVRGEIQLLDVCFRYPARPDVNVFTNFNLVVPAGKTVALVGSSGSGKSTVVQLIERFYDPHSGVVLLDGVDLRQYNLKWLRSQVGLVSQEPTLFATNIYENILMGRPGSSKEQVEAAAQAANAHEFITRLPLGYDTHVGERGLQLSGGQKQRIAIARAMLKNPKILLLDEATSALDTQSERVVQEALERMVVGRTTVVVAHRLSTIRDADVIAVVKHGEVVAQGRHEDLIQDPTGPYTLLVKLQMQHEAEEEAEHHPNGISEGEEEDEEEDDEEEEEEEGDGKDKAAVVKSREEVVVVDEEAGLGAAGASGPGSAGGHHHHDANGHARAGSHDGRDVHKIKRHSAEAPAPASASGEEEAAKGGKAKGKKGKKGKKEQGEKEVDVSFTRLAALNKPEWRYAVVGSLGAIVLGSIQPVFSLVISGMLAAFYDTTPDEILSNARFYCGMFAVIGAGNLISCTVQQYCFGVMGQHLARRVRTMLLRAMLYMEIGWFDLDSNSSGVLTSRLSSDASYVRGAVGDTIGLMLQNLTCLVLGFFISFFYDWRMSLVVLGAMPFMLTGSIIYYKFVTGFESGSDKLYASANQAVSDAFSSIRVVQAYNLQQQIGHLYENLLTDANKTMFKRSLMTGGLMGFSQFTIFGVYSLIIYFGGHEVHSGRATFEEMLKAFLAILLAAMGLAQAQVGFPDIGKAKAAVRSIFPMLDRKSLINASDPAGLAPPQIQGAIQLVDVHFVYPARPGVVVFRHFNLTIPAGKTVALVGESGSGKSTIVGLIERFYDPLHGAVLLDGVDLRQYNLKWLRSQIALVSQEPLLFSASIMDNIRYGNPGASVEEVEAAARAANAHDFIAQQPQGYNTQVGEKGVQLSGGQKQRVAIARAMVKNPRILLLDEATSALDAASEAVVQEALERIMGGRTSVVVAHRLSTIRNADSIALVFRGHILEQGTHEELMQNPAGGYARLVQAQMGSKSMARLNSSVGTPSRKGSKADLTKSPSNANLAN